MLDGLLYGLLDGGCQCGAIRYRIDPGAIDSLYCCHCLTCQQQAASAFGMSMKVRKDGLSLRGREPMAIPIPTDSALSWLSLDDGLLKIARQPSEADWAAIREAWAAQTE